MKIVVGCDHAGLEAKQEVFDILEHISCSYEDIGVFNEEKNDLYPNIAKEVCKHLLEHKAEFGILICGSGSGMSIAANRFKGIRAALCYDKYSAQMARLDNNCNVLCLRAREFDLSKYHLIIKTFLQTHFSEEIRHKKRVHLLDTITEIEEF